MLNATPNVWWWIGFNVLILVLLSLDLGVFNRKTHAPSARESLGWSVVWVSLAIGFGIWIQQSMGRPAMLEFYAGYLVELALSVDNLFVFILIFGYFRIPASLQHRVLFWGILGALIMRGLMIGAGAALLARFHGIIYVFGAFLVITGIRMAFGGDTAIEPESNPVIRLVRRFFPITTRFHGDRFFVREPVSGSVTRLVATPLFVVLALVETTDVVFAVDSIPAIFGVTQRPFLVYTSNVFAILGLRSMYFLLAGSIATFHLLKYGLALVLAFVGVKMLLSTVMPLSIGLSLGVVAGVLVSSIGLSLLFPAKVPDPESMPHAPSHLVEAPPSEDTTANTEVDADVR
jgi:tellurite resistance protein TerC